MGRVDLRFKLGVLGVGALIVGAIVFLRFCGDVGVAPKPPRPRFDTTAKQVHAETLANADAYAAAVARDASRAGLPAPTKDELGKAFTFQRDDQRRTLIPGGAPIDVAGLRLTARSVRPPSSESLVVLDIMNPGTEPLAYVVDTAISGGDSACFGRTILEHNAMVVAPGKTERRSECAFKRGMELYVSRVETAALTPMAAFYVSRLQPQAVSPTGRIVNGHKPGLAGGVMPCGLAMSASVRQSLADGSLGWRDLIDFFARHSCENYQFPLGYKAFTNDGERPLPDVGE